MIVLVKWHILLCRFKHRVPLSTGTSIAVLVQDLLTVSGTHPMNLKDHKSARQLFHSDLGSPTPLGPMEI